MKTVVNKDAKDWTLDEQKVAATDIAKNGTSSVIYAKAKAAMDAGTKFSIKLTNGQTLRYYIIGINHDDLADGSGRAGLTFYAEFTNGIKGRLNPTDTNTGGWEKSELRANMNSGDLWNLMPSDFQGKVSVVYKETNNDSPSLTKTADKLFLPSYTELTGEANDYGCMEGTLYGGRNLLGYAVRTVSSRDYYRGKLMSAGISVNSPILTDSCPASKVTNLRIAFCF